MARPLSTSALRGDQLSTWIERPPSPDLRGWIDASWIGMGGWSRSLRLLPDGSADLVWNGEELSLHPAQTCFRYSRVSVGRPIVGLRLACGVGGLLTDVVGGVVQLHLQDVWGSLAQAAVARLHHTSEPEVQLEVLSWLVQERRHVISAPDPRVLKAVEYIRRQPGRSIVGVGERVGLSPREMRRRFAVQVGISPKALQRVVRAEMVVHLLRAEDPKVRLADVAAELGYSDQAHMTHECRSVLGATPGQLRPGRPG